MTIDCSKEGSTPVEFKSCASSGDMLIEENND